MIKQNKLTITALICARNEEGSIIHVLPKIPKFVTEVLLIDGHSSDKTIEVAKEVCPNIRVLFQPNEGKGDAMKYGIEQTSSDIVVMLDADGQNNPEDINELIKPLLNGFDFAKGSRLAKGRPDGMLYYRWVGNYIIALTCNILYKTKFSDLCSGYNAFWRKPFLDINPWAEENWGYEPLFIARLLKSKLKICEVPHSYAKRINGKSNLPSLKQGLTAIMVLFRERFRG